jgi:hypothetical protein
MDDGLSTQVSPRTARLMLDQSQREVPHPTDNVTACHAGREIENNDTFSQARNPNYF